MVFVYLPLRRRQNVDPKIYTKYFVVIENLIWGRKNDVGNDIFRKQRYTQIQVGKDGFY